MPIAPAGFSMSRVLARSEVSELFEVGEHVCKRLSRRALDDEGARASAKREAAILGHLAGRGAPRLIAAGEDEHGPWLVMDRARGNLLLDVWIDDGFAPTPEAMLRVSLAAFGALARVHSTSVIHGDLSPKNIFFEDDEAVLIDFGLARYVHDTHSTETFAGTAMYAAPEAARGERIDDKSDVFALAASIVHAVTLEPPRKSASLAALLLEAGTEPIAVPPLDMPPSLHRMLVAALSFDAKARPTAQGVLDGLHG